MFNPLLLLKPVATFAAANPERYQRMIILSLFVAYSVILLGAGWWIGHNTTKRECDIKTAAERIAALEATTEAYLMIAELEEKHAKDYAGIEEQVASMERSINKTIDHILKTNPDVARWYHEPINVLHHAVMYGAADRMLPEGNNGQRQNTH